jgi:parvulin-like peptidyl-prolyl isomerase
MQQKTVLIAIVVLLVVAVGAWFFISKGESSPQNDTSELSDAVALVNGEEITRTELENSEAQLATQQEIDVASLDATGREQLQTQALDALIANTLIQQAVARSGLTATEEDINAQIETVKSQFPDEAQFQEALLGQGLSEADLREQVRGEVVTQRYLNQTLDLASVTVTDEEVSALYEQEAAVTEDVPPLPDVRGQIESFVIQQKQQELLVVHIQELRSVADIEILI